MVAPQSLTFFTRSKFVDSHLKPYRCKMDSCENARFSSTACLLRHEREAHAMHGHGDKPYLCTYEGCDRAHPGNGFPRQWNLKDHMRRVHNDSGASLNMAGSPPTQPAASQPTKGRKRKSKDADQGSSSRKQAARSAANVADVAAARKAQEQSMFNDWNDHRHALQNYLQEYSTPDDFKQLDHIGTARDHLEAMGKISQKLIETRKSNQAADSFRRSYVHTG